MKSKKLLELLKTNDLVIPSVLLMNYKELKLTEKELIFMAFLMSNEEEIVFDPVSFSSKLGFETNEIMEIFSNLSSKKYVDIVVKKENDKMREYITLEAFYEKLVLLLIETTEEKEEEQELEIYSIIENEFGRPLSSIELETISGWVNSNIEESLIKEALKEAVLNGIHNLKYIDKILYEWAKKGYKKGSDVKKKRTKEPQEIELFDYDWLEEND